MGEPCTPTNGVQENVEVITNDSPPLTKTLRSLRSFKRKARKSVLPVPTVPSEEKVLEISITVGYLGGDVNLEELDNLHRLLKKRCICGLASLEREELEAHLHFQMVARAYGTTGRAFGSVVCQYMGWNSSNSKEKGRGKITCKLLVQRNLHTFTGMLGYCVKDQGLEHFKIVAENVTEEQIKEGRTLHQLYGKELKGKVVLTSRNLFERAYMYHQYSKRKMISRTFAGILLGMMKSSKYYPSATWVIPTHGRGMDIRSASSLWTCLLHPKDTSLEDVFNVFFDNRSPVRGRYHREEFEHVEEVQKELEGKAKEAAARENIPSPPKDVEIRHDLGDLTWEDNYVPLVQPRPMFDKDYMHFTPIEDGKISPQKSVEHVHANGIMYDRNIGRTPTLVGSSCPKSAVALDIESVATESCGTFLDASNGHGGTSYEPEGSWYSYEAEASEIFNLLGRRLLARRRLSYSSA